MVRYYSEPGSATSWLAVCGGILLVALLVLYLWVWYAVARIDRFAELVYRTHDDDSRQDVQISATAGTVAAHRVRIDDLTTAVRHLDDDQRYQRATSRNLIRSLTIVNERLRAVAERQDRAFAAIRQVKEATPGSLNLPSLEDILPDDPDPPPAAPVQNITHP